MTDLPAGISMGKAKALPPPFLQAGFRPLFLAGAAWAVAAVGLWLAALLGGPAPGGASYGSLLWHAHEMVYGLGAGIVGGFLLTAVPSWTGQPKLTGRGLAGLAAVWVVARFAMLAPDGPGVPVVAALDLAFLAALALRTAWQVRAARNWRNLPMVAGPIALLAGNALMHAEAAGLLPGAAEAGVELGLLTIVLMIGLIGGRIIPAFTRNWLLNTGRAGALPAEPDRFDAAVLVLTAGTVALWLAAEDAAVTGAAAGLVAAGHLVRLGRWQGWRTGAEPLVWVLHLGYLWVPVGFALMAASVLAPATVPKATVLHAFGTGAMATMMLAMMTRATLGHTGRPLAADRATTAIYVLITAAALSRLVAALAPGTYQLGLGLSGAAWILAFAIYLAAYAPMLCGRRRDG